MHDPMVVAFDVRRPWPSRSGLPVKEGRPRWEWTIYRKHGLDHPGWNPRRWWRPGSWSPFVTVFGRRWWFPSLIIVWHVEPKGRDSGEVCKHWVDGKHRNRWRWHVWHWHVQVVPEQKLRRWLLERCELCGLRYPWGYAPVSHQWDRPGSRWRDGLRQRRAYHHDCSSFVSVRRTVSQDEELIRALVAALRLQTDESEEELVARLTDPKQRSMEFGLAYRLTHLLGFDRDDDYNLVRKS